MTKQNAVRVFYLRDEFNHPVACVASLREPQATRIAISQCSPRDQFIRKTGRLKAIGRLEGMYSFYVTHIDGRSIKVEILSALLTIPSPIQLQPRTLQAIRHLWTQKTFIAVNTIGLLEELKKGEGSV